MGRAIERPETLKRRREFLWAAGSGQKWVAPGLILQVRVRDTRDSSHGEGTPIRFGLTASKKVGAAVQRNRTRRRLRALALDILARHALGGRDYVLIGRRETAERPHGDLIEDLKKALRRLKAWRDADNQDSGNQLAGPTASP